MERRALLLVVLSAVNATSCEAPRLSDSHVDEEGGTSLVEDSAYSIPAPAPIAEPVVEVGVPVVLPPLPSEEEMAAQIADLEREAARRRARERAREAARHTPVRDAYGQWNDMFVIGLPGVRRAARRRFNRSFSEERLVNTRWPEPISSEDQVQLDAEQTVFLRVCVNEANWPHRECDGHGPCDTLEDHNHAELDCPAIFNVFRHTRQNGETLMGTMRRHVSYATEEVIAIESSRARWVQELQLDCSRPEHFPRTDTHGDAIDWDRSYAPRCRDAVELTRRLFANRGLGPTASAPIVTWGGRCEDRHGACDDHHAIARRLVPFVTAGTSNRFWCSPRAAGCLPEGATAVDVLRAEGFPETIVALYAEPPID